MTMNTQEILTEILKLPRESQKQVLDSLACSIGQPQPISEDEAERILAAQGLIRLPPDAADYTDEDEDFEPVEFTGKPLSEMIIEERR